MYSGKNHAVVTTINAVVTKSPGCGAVRRRSIAMSKLGGERL
jgi:hypothetical protein